MDEDAEADFFLKCPLATALKKRVKNEAGVKLKAIPLSMGCENLKGLYKHDPYFKTVLIAVDADSKVFEAPNAPKHIIELPGAIDPTTGKGPSPERTLQGFIQDLAANKGDYLHSTTRGCEFDIATQLSAENAQGLPTRNVQTAD